jgi:hypothetical protein
MPLSWLFRVLFPNHAVGNHTHIETKHRRTKAMNEEAKTKVKQAIDSAVNNLIENLEPSGAVSLSIHQSPARLRLRTGCGFCSCANSDAP